MKLLFLLLGLIFGVGQYLLTKFIASRALAGKVLAVQTIVKIVSYTAVLLPVFLLAPRDYALRFGIGAGAGLLVAGVILSLVKPARGKR